jgi:capsular polysaccharide export protein
VRNFARLVGRRVRAKGPGDHAALPAYWAREWVQQRARSAVLGRLATREVPDSDAVFYPMHFADDAQITIRGEVYYDQFALVRQIADTAPYGYEVWTKPHPTTPGDLPVGSYAKLMRDKPNVRVLHPSLPAALVLGRAAAVVTVNSTVGLEALLHGVPVVTLGDSAYRGHGLTTDVDGPAALAEAVPAAISRGPAPDDQVARLVAWLISVTHDMTLMAFDLSAENGARFADALLEEFAPVMQTR